MIMDPKINASRDCHSFHYKECWLGDNSEAACQSGSSRGHCVQASPWVGWSGESMMPLDFLASSHQGHDGQ